MAWIHETWSPQRESGGGGCLKVLLPKAAGGGGQGRPSSHCPLPCFSPSLALKRSPAWSAAVSIPFPVLSVCPPISSPFLEEHVHIATCLSPQSPCTAMASSTVGLEGSSWIFGPPLTLPMVKPHPRKEWSPGHSRSVS